VSDDIGLSDCKVCFGRKRILVGMSLLPPSMPAQTATCRWWSQPTADRAASRAALIATGLLTRVNAKSPRREPGALSISC